MPIIEEELIELNDEVDTIDDEEEQESVEQDEEEVEEGIKAKLASKIYLPPGDKCGLTMDSIIGYNGKQSTRNLIWNPLNGLFAYTIGCIVIIEDSNTDKQTPLKNEHKQDITCITK